MIPKSYMTMKTIMIALLVLIGLTSCSRNKNDYDASGTFETTETIVSAEVSGVIKKLAVEEGQSLNAGQLIGYIDSMQTYLKKKQLEVQIRTTLSQKPNIPKQLASLQAQLKTAQREQSRIVNLLKSDAATTKQLDDINAQIDIITKQIEAQQSALTISSTSIVQQTNPIQVQIEQTVDQLSKFRIVNPVDGTVLVKYAQEFEMTSAGKPLYKIGNLSVLTLRAYVTADQFSILKLNQKVKVLVAGGKDQDKTYEGTIRWMSDKAEFTPKTIQTKDERANLVYAVKISVNNDGYLKIGMYADVKL
jgi:HlyD family secretion protein